MMMMMMMTMVIMIIIIILYDNGILSQNLYFEFTQHHLTMVQKGEQISSRKVTLGCETAAQRISDMTGC
jgi:hypothetical protein